MKLTFGLNRLNGGFDVNRRGTRLRLSRKGHWRWGQALLTSLAEIDVSSHITGTDHFRLNMEFMRCSAVEPSDRQT
jgi:hypothetical protein